MLFNPGCTLKGVNLMDIKNIITQTIEGLKEKASKDNSQGSEMDRNKKRAKMWVESLANNLKEAVDKDALMFYKGYEENKEQFGLTEYLHDILICTTEVAGRRENGKDLLAIKRVIWQVESELIASRDTRELLTDFNKLTLGSAQNKLFVMSHAETIGNEKLIKFFAKPASFCSGNLYLAFIPHPGVWTTSKDKAEVYEYVSHWKIIDL